MKKVFIYITYIIFVICFIRIIIYVISSTRSKEIVNITSEYVIPSKKLKRIDFNKFKSINSDIVGYLEVGGTGINYLVVKSKNNSYYLSHNLYHEYSSSGWIFMDFRNKLDGNDKNIVIYGHNMKDNTMFGTLSNVLKSKWRSNKENLIIKLTLEDGLHLYKVFSTYIVLSEEYYIKTSFDSDTLYDHFLSVIKSRSNYDYNEFVSSNNNILTLSTCYKNTNKRVVVHAYEIDLSL